MRELSAKQRKDQAEHNADNDAGDNWEIECAVAAFDADIARQTSEPAGANAAPEQKAKNNDHSSEDDEKFSELGHSRIWHGNISTARQRIRTTTPDFAVAAVYDRRD